MIGCGQLMANGETCSDALLCDVCVSELRAENARLRSENESLEKDAFDLGAYANGLAEKLEPMMNEAETASMRMCMELLDGMDESVYPEAYGYIALKMEEEHKKHTERVIITCPETCYCWEVEAFLIGREKALLILWEDVSGYEGWAMDGMADLAALRSENEQMRAQNVELLAGLEKIAAGNPAKVGGWLSDVEMADIARATIAKARGISLKEG